MPPPPPPHGRIGPVRGALPAPCAAAALSALSGIDVDRCRRVLERNHGYRPLLGAVTPAIATSLADLGFATALARHADRPPFAAWAATAGPGAYLVVVAGHVLAAEVVAEPTPLVRVADNAELCTPRPAPPGPALNAERVHETLRCVPRPVAADRPAAA